MRPIRVTVGAVGVSNPIPLDHYQGPFNVGLGVTLTPGAALTYTVQHTFDDVFAAGFTPAGATWFDHPTLSAETAEADGNYAFPVTAIRLNVTVWTGGSVTLTVIQAGMPGN